MIPMRDPIEQFGAAIASAGMEAPDAIRGDGKLHRFSPSVKRRDDAGWYVLHLDGVPAGVFGDWRTGLTQTWCSKADKAMTQAEREAHRQRIKAMQAERDAERAQRQHEASATAAARWQAATPTGTHPYLTAKGVQAHGTRVESDGYLVVPMRDADGKLWNIERINPADSKDKRGLPGGRRTGCYHSIGKPKDVLIVCEGFATSASIHEATGQAAAVAFTAGNLVPVAEALHAKYPALKIIIAADDDHLKDGNPGLTKATQAARAVGGLLAVPTFPGDRPDKATDFNDLHQLAGFDAVRRCIEAAKPIGDLSEQYVHARAAWPDPTPLPDGLPAVAPFDAELLPEALRGWVADIADRMQCPPDFTAVGAVVAISSLIGARAVVKPKARDDWAVVPNLWGAIVGRPGVMKSPALSEVLKPLHRLEANERELWQAAHEEWELDFKVTELAAKHNEKQAAAQAAKDPAKARVLLQPADDLSAEPTMRRYVINDATVEKLADLLTVNPWGTLVYRDEIHGLLCSMDRQGQEGARGFYLTGYDGNQGHAVDRIGRGESYVPRVCLAMLGGIQPGKVQSYVREAVAGGAGDDGLLQRFGLTVWPDVNREFVYVDRWPDTPARQAAWAVFERLSQLQPASHTEAQEWRFSPKAQAFFEEWLIPFETEIRGEELHPALVSHLSKYRKLIPALALIFALVDTPESGGVIHERELLRALDWGEYLRTHAERLYAAAVMPETTGAQALLNKIRAGKLADSDGVLLAAFTPRQVAVKHWAGLGTPDAVRKASELLADYGWLEREAIPSGAAGGRPSECYRVHPTLMKGSLR
jgi:putative DNA primase/helicase